MCFKKVGNMILFGSKLYLFIWPGGWKNRREELEGKSDKKEGKQWERKRNVENCKKKQKKAMEIWKNQGKPYEKNEKK